ncbi:uncharacterized protein E0L32_011408 [Thyridium curvatum]|uniref:Kelch repeat-containing protein n=1 Tax=Thyridium curvatum TaxID=1093900 RepID=A0A507BQ59_9PEZI|nr:uncharacterized protein E0L32_011408 [Thyridium curvatum]TPX18930.1 hypothetical protein E0L32_011408 [Thyridium curvatum]
MKYSWLTGAALAIVAPALAQQGRWIKDQVNATMCYWEQPRAMVMRDTLYIDGGALWWRPGMIDGSYGQPTNDGNPLSLVYRLNFSHPFNTTQNISAILDTLSKTGGGGAGNNIAPTYLDGAMLGNDAEWFLYGGVTRKTDAFEQRPSTDILEYEAFAYGVDNLVTPGFLFRSLTANVTRYLAYGAGANAPSENKAWYFSGMHSPTFEEFFTVGARPAATNVSNTLITLDMTRQGFERWTNDTLTGGVQGRANPELVWVPVGKQGILVAIGGVVYPDFLDTSAKSPNKTGSESESPKFLSTIDIYDVASKNWYQQETTGGPSTGLTRGCAVVAPAQDNSSFNIYWYGGYSGISGTDPFSDEVWVLSLPSFVWKRISEGKPGHGRAGHKCFLPYPDQLMVVGGYPSKSTSNCVDGGIIQFFNLNTNSWQTSYDPATWSKYEVPEALYKVIGGSKTGAATMTTPTPSGWTNGDLSKVFASPYPYSKIKAYYPYPSVGPDKNATNPNLPQKDNGSGVPKFLPPLLGVICGLMLVTAIAVGILLYRRRNLIKKNPNQSERGSEDPGNRIISWIRGQPTEKAATTTTSDEGGPPHTPPMSMSTPDGRPTPHSEPSELPDSMVAELGDTSTPLPAELSETGLTPAEIVQRHSHFAHGGGNSLNNPSQYSNVTQTDHASTVSRSTGANPPAAAGGAVAGGGGSTVSDPRPDSPPLGAAGGRGASGVSGVSEGDRQHLRQVSDTTVESVALRGGGLQSAPVSPEPEQSSVFGTLTTTPGISPPSPAADAEDYLSARRITETSMGQGSPLPSPPLPLPLPQGGRGEVPGRKSAFYEHDGDGTDLNK